MTSQKLKSTVTQRLLRGIDAAEMIALLIDPPGYEDSGLDEQFARLGHILSGLPPELRHAVRNMVERLDVLPDPYLRITLMLLREMLDGMAESTSSHDL